MAWTKDILWCFLLGRNDFCVGCEDQADGMEAECRFLKSHGIENCTLHHIR